MRELQLQLRQQADAIKDAAAAAVTRQQHSSIRGAGQGAGADDGWQEAAPRTRRPQQHQQHQQAGPQQRHVAKEAAVEEPNTGLWLGWVGLNVQKDDLARAFSRCAGQVCTLHAVVPNPRLAAQPPACKPPPPALLGCRVAPPRDCQGRVRLELSTCRLLHALLRHALPPSTHPAPLPAACPQVGPRAGGVPAAGRPARRQWQAVQGGCSRARGHSAPAPACAACNLPPLRADGMPDLAFSPVVPSVWCAVGRGALPGRQPRCRSQAGNRTPGGRPLSTACNERCAGAHRLMCCVQMRRLGAAV